MYVSAFPMCAQNNTLTNCPAGLLQPHAVQHNAWLDIHLDYVTGLLPISKGYSPVLTVMDRFSESVKYIPFPKIAHSLVCV